MLGPKTCLFIFISLSFWSQITALYCIFTHLCPNFRCLWLYPLLCVCLFLKQRKCFFFHTQIYRAYIFVFDNISPFLIKADTLDLPNFWVWLLFPLNNCQFQCLFYLEYLSISCKHIIVSDYTIFSPLSLLTDNGQSTYLDCILWETKQNTFGIRLSTRFKLIHNCLIEIYQCLNIYKPCYVFLSKLTTWKPINYEIDMHMYFPKHE